MSHGLDKTRAGKIRMAYSDVEIPWHRMGKPMAGLQTAQDMLRAAEADFEVILTRVAAVDHDGNVIFALDVNGDPIPLLIDDSRATIRLNSDGTHDALSTVGTRYVVQQNTDCLNRALDIVGASSGDAVVDTCGVINGGREFFASIDLGPLVIDPTGINDKMERYLLVRNGHDGKTPITYANTSVRAVCKNTVNAGIKSALRIFTARHTKNQENVVSEAQAVLEISTEWAQDFTETAEKMLRIPMPMSSRRFDSFISELFPAKQNETARQKKNRENVNEIIRVLYSSEKNAGGFGFNGWSAYNAAVEYFDHFRDATPDDRATSSMDPTSWVSKKKEDAQDIILSMAGRYS